jgi:hypothetical protein
MDFGALQEAVNLRMSLEESLERRLRREGRVRRRGKGSNATNKATVNVLKPAHIRLEAFEPISQGKFLAQIGFAQRVDKKIEDPETTDEEAFEIYSAMERLIVAEQMGERSKVMAIALKKDRLFQCFASIALFVVE